MNLLDDPLIRIVGAAPATLPDLCARIARGEAVPGFPALRPHQRHAWHAFLVQLGLIALERAGVEVSQMPLDADAWRDLLHGLTPDHPGDDPWRLVVDDTTVPAFMQPPTVNGESSYKQRDDTPDDIDILVASRHHSIKAGAARRARPDDWLFALITLQTMGGYGGPGLYGVARMNGGYSSRPAFSLVPAGADFGACVQRDIVALHGQWAELRRDSPFSGDAALLWLDPWGGTKSEMLPPGGVHPLAIEICRRIRLRTDETGDGIFAIRASSKARRIAAADLHGLTGDPWTPRSTDKVLHVSPGAAFQYDHISTLLGPGDWRLPLLCHATPDEKGSGARMHLIARAVIGGQGRTDGYRERIIPLGASSVRALGVADSGLGAIARDCGDQVKKVQTALRSALYTFIASDAGDSSANFEHVRAWQNRLDEIVEDSFFDALQTEFEAAEADRSAVRHAWLRVVVDAATAIFRDAMLALPHHAARRYRARAQAERRFQQRLRGPNGVPSLYHHEADGEHDAA